MNKRIEIYDTTLRDGTRVRSINFSVADKCRIAEGSSTLLVLTTLKVAGGSNPRDVAFLQNRDRSKLTNARIAAFGATVDGLSCDNDSSIQSLLQAKHACRYHLRKVQGTARY